MNENLNTIRFQVLCYLDYNINTKYLCFFFFCWLYFICWKAF